ncbi:MAG: hypothetical protein Q7S04_02875 [Candidatus Moranbacteria bacterium]|nr:hypothetical protein [Candidatus Moranbacteria bacterium]
MAKRNLIKIPQVILERIRTFDQDDIVVACAKLLRPEDISRYAHLGLALVDGKLIIPSPAIPNPDAGRYSKANVEGYEKIRKDLPKVPKEFSFEAPDWGDWSNGSHTVAWTRNVYRRDFYPPKEVELSITLVEEKSTGFVVKFAIDQVMNRRTENFEQELFYNLNLLQENVGAADVFRYTASLADYAATIRVDWVILPPGTVDEVIRGMLKGKSKITPAQEATMKERVTLMSRLEPEVYIAGSDGFLRYFGAKFGDDFVAFENIRYGNAIYVMYDSWEELSKKSRIDLLSGPRDSFDRIEHRDGWEERFSAMVQGYRDKKKNKKS